MTAYRLAAVEFRQIVSRDEKGDPTEIRRYRQGDPIELDGSEEQRLLAANALIPAEVVDAADENAKATAEWLDAESKWKAEQANTTGTGEPAADAGGQLEKPKKAAPVDDWRIYAISRGFTEEQAEALTKAELIEKLDN